MDFRSSLSAALCQFIRQVVFSKLCYKEQGIMTSLCFYLQADQLETLILSCCRSKGSKLCTFDFKLIKLLYHHKPTYKLVLYHNVSECSEVKLKDKDFGNVNLSINTETKFFFCQKIDIQVVWNNLLSAE